MVSEVFQRGNAFDELDRAISESTGELPANGAEWGVEPSLAKTVRALASLHRSPQPGPEFAARLATQFGVSATLPSSMTTPIAGLRPRRIARSPRPVLERAAFWLSPPVRRMTSLLSVLVLLGVMAGGMWLTVDVERALNGGPTRGDSAEIAGTFPGLRNGANFVMRRITLEPGDTIGDVRDHPMFVVVLDGAIRFRDDADRSERVLEPGEIGASAFGGFVTVDNNAGTAATILEIGIYPAATHEYVTRPYKYPGVTVEQVASGPVGLNLTGSEPYSLRLVMLEAGEKADRWTTSGPAWIVVEQGQIGLTLTGEHLPFGFEPGVERERSAGSTIALLPGVTIDARNTGGEQTMVIILTVDLDSVTAP